MNKFQKFICKLFRINQEVVQIVIRDDLSGIKDFSVVANGYPLGSYKTEREE